MAGTIITIVWDKVAGILPFFSPIFNLAMKVFQNYIHDSPERSDQQGIYCLESKSFCKVEVRSFNHFSDRTSQE